MERKKTGRVFFFGGGGLSGWEGDGKERRGDKKHSQSNLTAVDVWGCKETR